MKRVLILVEGQTEETFVRDILQALVNPTETNARLAGANIVVELQQIKATFSSPEEINDNPATAPSKRLLKLYDRYRKNIHGPTIVKNVGLTPLRRECSHFNEWLTWLEGLGKI